MFWKLHHMRKVFMQNISEGLLFGVLTFCGSNSVLYAPKYNFLRNAVISTF